MAGRSGGLGCVCLRWLAGRIGLGEAGLSSLVDCPLPVHWQMDYGTTIALFTRYRLLSLVLQ